MDHRDAEHSQDPGTSGQTGYCPPNRQESHGEPHAGSHRVLDLPMASASRGLWALKWSFLGLTATALIQTVVVLVSGSVALLADAIHNFADAATALPLGIAFGLTRRRATRRFTYGFGRVEDVAGLAIILTILASGLIAAVESFNRLLQPRPLQGVWAVILASVIGFVGNEAVAVFRIRIGRQIGSAALLADGQHARVDGWTSLSVLAGAVGVWAGYPLADPLVGLLISVAIFALVWQSARSILVRMLDGVETETLDEIVRVAQHVPRVEEVTDVRARWIGHRLQADLSITVPANLSVAQGHVVANEVRHQLLHHVQHLGTVHVHVDPSGEGGEHHHGIAEHAHDGLPPHAHP